MDGTTTCDATTTESVTSTGSCRRRSVTVDVGYVRSLLSQLERINAIPLEQIDLFDGGERIDLTPEIIEEWRMIGMSNQAFIEMEFWKRSADGSD